jgi:hypothetical protein
MVRGMLEGACSWSSRGETLFDLIHVAGAFFWAPIEQGLKGLTMLNQLRGPTSKLTRCLSFLLPSSGMQGGNFWMLSAPHRN